MRKEGVSSIPMEDNICVEIAYIGKMDEQEHSSDFLPKLSSEIRERLSDILSDFGGYSVIAVGDIFTVLFTSVPSDMVITIRSALRTIPDFMVTDDNLEPQWHGTIDDPRDTDSVEEKDSDFMSLRQQSKSPTSLQPSNRIEAIINAVKSRRYSPGYKPHELN